MKKMLAHFLVVSCKYDKLYLWLFGKSTCANLMETSYIHFKSRRDQLVESSWKKGKQNQSYFWWKDHHLFADVLALMFCLLYNELNMHILHIFGDQNVWKATH